MAILLPQMRRECICRKYTKFSEITCKENIIQNILKLFDKLCYAVNQIQNYFSLNINLQLSTQKLGTFF